MTDAAADTAHNIVARWRRRPEISGIEWQDLLNLSRREIFSEMTLSLPWLAAELALLSFGYIIPALFCAFFFFLTGLRQVHGGFHYSLGLSARKTDSFLFAMSVLMLGAMHAVKFNHLLHHRHCLDEHDIEAKSAHMSGLRAILFGPVFPLLLHANALRRGNASYRAWIMAELAANIAVSTAGMALQRAGISPVLLWHCGLMLAGQCLTAFFAVWTVHHGCGDDVFARTQRGRLKNLLSYDMFYHVEHHLFPKVPQRRLKVVARRLDGAAPELTVKNVY